MQLVAGIDRLARLAALDRCSLRAEQRRLEIAAHGIGVESGLRARQLLPESPRC